MLEGSREPSDDLRSILRANASGTSPPVDLVVNVFERTYRRLTDPATFEHLARSHRFPFARRVLLVNNVEDPTDARLRAARLLAAGPIDEVHFVERCLDRALDVCGLNRSDLEPLLHFCDAPLVALTLPGSPWMVYWDAEATLDSEVDWVTPACTQLRQDPRLLVANPSWEPRRPDGAQPAVEHETYERDGEFAIGPGFSDQAFLARRADLARPIYRDRCIGMLVHPRAHKVATFEARINAHMRHHGRLRATYLTASYSIDQPDGAVPSPPGGVVEWGRYIRNAAVLRSLRRSPWRPGCLRQTWIDGPRTSRPVRSRSGAALAASNGAPAEPDAVLQPQLPVQPVRRCIVPNASVVTETQPVEEMDNLLGV